jgi:hypothetical protein
MKMVLLIAVLLSVAGCSAGRWVQAGKSDLDSRRDAFDCENVIVT